MSDRTRRSRGLAAAAVTLVAAVATFLLFKSTGILFFLLMPLVMAVTNHPSAAYLIPYVVLPLVAVVFWRQPWWVRWVFAGFVLHNLALLLFIDP